MTKKSRREPANPWNDPEKALEMLKQHYPKIPLPILHRCVAIWDQTKKMDEKGRKKVHKIVEDAPRFPMASEYIETAEKITCVEIEEPNPKDLCPVCVSRLEIAPIYCCDNCNASIHIDCHKNFESNTEPYCEEILCLAKPFTKYNIDHKGNKTMYVEPISVVQQLEE